MIRLTFDRMAALGDLSTVHVLILCPAEPQVLD